MCICREENVRVSQDNGKVPGAHPGYHRKILYRAKATWARPAEVRRLRGNEWHFRYLIPFDFTFHQFLQVIRKRLVLEKDQALTIFFSNNKLQQNEKLMSQIYEECKDEDGFLYCKYASYEVYGAAISNEWSKDPSVSTCVGLIL